MPTLMNIFITLSIISLDGYVTRLATVLIFGIFCPQGVSWGTDNSLRVPRDATPSRYPPTFPHIKPAKINLSLLAGFGVARACTLACDSG